MGLEAPYPPAPHPPGPSDKLYSPNRNPGHPQQPLRPDCPGLGGFACGWEKFSIQNV